MAYEYEIERTNVTPKQFFSYCKRSLNQKGFDMETWIDWDCWSNPPMTCDSENECTLTGKKEVCKMKPYDFQMFHQGCYNIIVTFDFYDERKGYGYLYMVEHV